MEARTIVLADNMEGCKEQVDLDEMILSTWDRFMAEGNFRYRVEQVAERVLPGARSYLAQYQPCRATLRRPPQSMTSLAQPFDPARFNFTKVDLIRERVATVELLLPGEPPAASSTLLINVSPIGRGHCLLVPELASCLPQMLTRHALLLALSTIRRSASPNIKLAFNSLCAYASVNHLHWHLYYQSHLLPCQTSVLAGAGHGQPCQWSTPGYPAAAWVWLINGAPTAGEMEHAAGQVFTLTKHLTAREVAHNVLVTRGAGGAGGALQSDLKFIRVIVWPREKVVGAKEAGKFVMAVLELSGQILVYDEEKFNSIAEDEVEAAQAAATQEVFNNLRQEVVELFS